MRFFVPTAVAALVLSVVPAHAATDPALDKVLRQMDAASVKFQSAEADLKWDFFEKVVRETTTQTGSIYFLRKNGSTEMGAVISSPGKKYLHFANNKGDLYDAIAKKDTPFDGGADKARTESLLTLGFGGSGKDLEKAWTIALQGTETVDGTSTAKLDLTPKDPTVAQTFTHITVWVDTTRDISLKQQAFTPEGDTRTSYFTNIRYNASVDMKKYKH